MTDTILISSADKNYFPMLHEWVLSVRSFAQSKGMDIGILDSGLTPDQVKILEGTGCIVRAAEWPCDIPAHKIRGKDYLKSCVCRPFLPTYFPGYETILWMDADTWVQDWRAIDLYIRGAAKGALAICPQADRAYGKAMRLSWLGPFPWKARSFYYSNARHAFSGKVARALFPYPAMNAGVFALRADAPHWKRWQELIAQALKKGKVFTAEQLTLGILVYLEGYRAEFLPAWCNWLCETKPAYDTRTKLFVEPSLPHEVIGVVHLSGWDKMRLDRSIVTDFKTLDGQTVQLSYRYPFLTGSEQEAA